MLWKDDKKKAITVSYDDGYIHDKKLIELFDNMTYLALLILILSIYLILLIA